MTTPTDDATRLAALRTPEEVLEAAIEAALSAAWGGAISTRTARDAANAIRALASRIAPPDPRHEGLWERIEAWLRWIDGDCKPPLPDGSLIGVLRECLAALEPAAPQPTADDVVREVEKIADRGLLTFEAAERAIRAAFAEWRADKGEPRND